MSGNGWRGNHWRIASWSAAALLLLPLVAQPFTDEVNWTAADFVVFGGVLAIGFVGAAVARFRPRRLGSRGDVRSLPGLSAASRGNGDDP